MLAWLTLYFPISAEIAPRSKRPRGPQGWCADPGVQADMNAAWQQREVARKSLRASPNSDFLRKAVKKASKNLEKVRKAAVLSFFLAHVRKLEERVRKGDQAGFYGHLKTMDLEGNCNSLRNRLRAVARWVTEGTPNLDWRGFICLLAWGKLLIRGY